MKLHCMLAVVGLLLAGAGVRGAGFEVSASLYPWDVHDEGIEVMLDNLTELAGVNSVYLIAVMHQEHRPFFGPEDKGPWLYPHNPRRREWWAEDSRAFFHPQRELYGSLEPSRSDFPWLRETDWLKVVVEAARKRGLKVGAEVSHTFLPKSVMINLPDDQQRGLRSRAYEQYDSPYGRGAQEFQPCINSPRVQEYLKALYADLARHYDLDFVQTCMWTFRGEDVANGTCFCHHCQREARAMGFDLEAAIPLLRDNPKAQPHLQQWLDFRVKATTRVYQMIVEAMREARPRIDFRINDLNNRGSGLHLETLAGTVTSIHLSTHTEQMGIEKTDRESRMATLQHFLPAAPLIPGVPVRILATPEIVRSSIRRSVRSGAAGIALKHYDGATYGLLRAVRTGLSEAGVEGFTPVLGMEVEDMRLEGFAPDRFLLESGVRTQGTGTAVATFPGESGTYDVVVSHADEKGGRGRVTFSAGGRERAAWVLEEDVDCWRRRAIPQVMLRKGDEIRIVGVAEGTETVRLDFIEFHGPGR